MVIGPGSVNLMRRLVWARRKRASVACTRPLSCSGADHLRHHRLVAVVADAHLDLVLEVDALDLLEEAVHEVLARLFAVADHVEAGVLLRLDPQQRGVELGLVARPAPSSRHCGQSFSVSASQAGLGRLPAMAAGNSVGACGMAAVRSGGRLPAS